MLSLFRRLRQGLARTRAQFTDRLQQVLYGKSLTEEVLDELEEVLVSADLGVDSTRYILDELANDPRRATSDAAWAVDKVRDVMRSMLAQGTHRLNSAADGPTVVLVVGVNGAGKTTTVGKLAARAAENREKVLIGAADTFRAAADEQLEIWARRAGAQIVQAGRGADAASVAYDAISAAKSRGMDLVLVDTAGRLHTRANLMDELRKIVRVVKKHGPEYPHETLIVLDATSGQNAVQQARMFHQAIGVTGIAITKLDSTARGGVILAISQELGIPVKLIGVGEGIEDLQDFDPDAFIDALFGVETRE